MLWHLEVLAKLKSRLVNLINCDNNVRISYLDLIEYADDIIKNELENI